MRHRIDTRKLGRTSSHRGALFRNLAISLIKHGRVQTTLPKAKELRRVADRLVTLGKRNTLHTRRQAFGQLRDQQAVTKLFREIAPAFQERKGGYTRLYQLRERRGDAATVAMIEYLREDIEGFKIAGVALEPKKKNVETKKTLQKKSKTKKDTPPTKETK